MFVSRPVQRACLRNNPRMVEVVDIHPAAEWRMKPHERGAEHTFQFSQWQFVSNLIYRDLSYRVMQALD
jgi:hypothetical protein